MHGIPAGSRYLRMSRIYHARLFQNIFPAIYEGKHGPNDLGNLSRLRKDIEAAVNAEECPPERIKALAARLLEYQTEKKLDDAVGNSVYGQMTHLVNSELVSIRMLLLMARSKDKAKAKLLEGLETLDGLFEMYSKISNENDWIVDCVMGAASAREAVELWKAGAPASASPAIASQPERMSPEYLAVALDYVVYINGQITPAKQQMLEFLEDFRGWAGKISDNTSLPPVSLAQEAVQYENMLVGAMKNMRNTHQLAQLGLELGVPEREVNARIFQDYLTSTLGCAGTGSLIDAILANDLAAVHRRAHIIELEIGRAFKLFDLLDNITESRITALFTNNYIGRALRQIEKNETAQP